VFIKNVFVSLLLPPFGFVTLTLLAILLPASMMRARRVLIALSTAGLILLGMPVVADRILNRLEQDLPRTPSPTAPPAAIVVLGAEIRRTSDIPEAVVGPLSLERLRIAAQLHRRTGLPVLISGGALQPDLPSIADIMAGTMRDDFLTPVAWTENRSRDTWENARFSAEILKAAGIGSVYVVTHAWHMKRALLAFARTGLTATAAPTPPDERDGAILDDFLPRASTWTVSYFALHEWIGYAWYALR